VFTDEGRESLSAIMKEEQKNSDKYNRPNDTIAKDPAKQSK